jgi:hypothetical protein
MNCEIKAQQAEISANLAAVQQIRAKWAHIDEWLRAQPDTLGGSLGTGARWSYNSCV